MGEAPWQILTPASASCLPPPSARWAKESNLLDQAQAIADAPAPAGGDPWCCTEEVLATVLRAGLRDWAERYVGRATP